jgi:hypothetical protein
MPQTDSETAPAKKTTDLVAANEPEIETQQVAAKPTKRTPEAELMEDIHALYAACASIKIDSPDAYQRGGEMAKRTKALADRVHAMLDLAVEEAHKMHKTALAHRSSFLSPIDDALKIVKRKMGLYNAEQQRLHQEARRKAQLEALKAEEERQLEVAAQLEAEGRNDEAEAVLSEPVAAPLVPAAEDEPAKAPGVSHRTIWTYEIIDSNLIPRQYMRPDEPKIAAFVRQHRERATMQGVRFFAKTSTIIRT